MDKDYLILKRAPASRPSGEWDDDAYDVLADGAVVGPRFLDLRAVRPRASMGKPRRRAFNLPGFQHQSGRRGGRPSRRACESTIAEESGHGHLPQPPPVLGLPPGLCCA